MMINIHSKWNIGGQDDYYANMVFRQLKPGHFYWVGSTSRIYEVIAKFGNYVLGRSCGKINN